MKKILRITTISASMNLLAGQLRMLAANGFDVVAVADGAEGLRRVEEREGVRTVEVPMHREISLRNDLRSLWHLYRLMRRERPDIVHANTPKGSLLAMMAAWAARVPRRIYLVTGLRFETAAGLFRTLLISMERLTCACATHVIPEGEGVKKTLLANGVTRRPLQVLHNGNINGIDPEEYSRAALTEEQTRPLASEGRFTFIFAGRMVRDKGIHELVRAYCKVHERHPATRLVLLGDFEPDLDPIDAEVAQTIASRPDIVTPGYVRDVRPWLATADVLVHPSYREGFANVVLQAGAMGLPCVVTDINGSNEVIVHEENGLIVPKQDTEALERAMERMISDTPIRLEMASKARDMVVSRYNRADVHQALLNFYFSILK